MLRIRVHNICRLFKICCFCRFEASGFCYINDIVLGILELLKYHKRQLAKNLKTLGFISFGQRKYIKGGFFWVYFYFYERYATLLHLPSLRFYCVGGCWYQTLDCCDFGIESWLNSDLIRIWIRNTGFMVATWFLLGEWSFLIFCHLAANRVLYIDIDIHHGDGVQEAFYVSDRSVRYMKEFFYNLLQCSQRSIYFFSNYTIRHLHKQKCTLFTFFSQILGNFLRTCRPLFHF